MGYRSSNKQEQAFTELLRAAVAAIREASKGRTCGQCVHFIVDECGRKELEWTIHTCAEAVACSKFKRR